MNLIDTDWMTPAELAARIHTSTGTLANWRAAGTGPGFLKLGSRVFYPERELEKWLQSRLEEAADHATKKQKRCLVLAPLDQQTGIHRINRTTRHKTRSDRRQENSRGEA